MVVNMDSIQQMVGGGEYGIYDKAKKDVYWSIENAAIESALKAGLSVVVDRTNMDRKRRERFIEIGKKHAGEVVSMNWGAGDKEALSRRQANPHGVPTDTWVGVFNYMQDSYQPPSLEEGFDKIIEAPVRFKFHAFDFDGTIVKNDFPDIGEVIDGTAKMLNDLWEDLSNIIIVWSCRNGDYENQMRAFLLKHKLPFDFINKNPMFELGGRKVYAHTYYDDRNIPFEG